MNYFFDYLPSLPHLTETCSLVIAFSLSIVIFRFRLFKDSDPRHGKAPFFGAQMAPDCEGTIEIGDPVFLSC